MKKSMTMGALFIALLTATSCSETETEIVDGTGDDDLVTLGITPNLKVDAGSKASTKSVVSGDLITYNAADYGQADIAPGLGIVITDKNATDWYQPDAGGYTGHHVWYMGDARGANWISIQTKGVDFETTREVPYFLTKNIGQVYAYYPYDPTLNIASATDLKIPVTILASGNIDASTNNAKKYWNGGVWTSTPRTNLINLSLSTEKDYLYFGADGGRYVNNGRTVGQQPVKPEDEPDNTNDVNPGYKINLDMKHAMAMVTFRVYDGGKLSDNDVNFTKFRIKNMTGGSDPFKMGTAYMSLVDGRITPNALVNGDISRTIDNYILMRQVETGGTEGQYSFVTNGTTVNAKVVSKAVSNIVYPTTFGDNDIEVIVTLKEGVDAAVDYPVVLPANSWDANNNYIYTLSAGRNKLTVMDVTVEAWIDNEEDEIPL
ncbi:MULTISPECIES: fimbrillin family protein [Parabacteroides]|uniref:fimbrillin family protein n=1 Tax=Parabacteroides TaxID=375288 RepID=UPI001F2FC073|nr:MULTISPECIES: fimbrillin family protein [Parabacteroides]